jgi:uncharacterized protein YjdB
MMRRLLLMGFLTSLLGLAGCGSSNTTASTTTGANPQTTLQAIKISPSTASIAAGTTQAFTATGNYSDGSTKDLTATAQWSCLIPTVATVSATAPTQGLATAVSSGKALITASSGGVSNSAQLSVTNATASTLAVTPAAPTIGYLNQEQFTATATFSDGTTQDVTNLATWQLVDPQTFQIEPFIGGQSGLAIGQSLGTSIINASFGSVSTQFATTPPTVTVDLSNLVSVAILPASPVIANNTQVTFSVLGTFSDGSTRDVTSLATGWASDNGAVTNYGAGPNIFSAAQPTNGTPANITASVGTFTPSATLSVTDATLESIAVSPSSATIAPSVKLDFTAVGTFSDGSTQDLSGLVKWTSTNPPLKISAGEATGVAPGGSATVYATSPASLGKIVGSVPVTVSSATVQSIAVSPASAFITPGNSFPFTVMATFSDGSTQDVSSLATFSSSNSAVSSTTTEVATMSSNLATGQGVGKTTITAKWSKLSATASLMVVPPAQISLSLNSTSASVAAGATTKLSATGTYRDGTTQDFTSLVNWSSSTPANATVGYQTGVVSGVASGPSTITATLGSVTATAQVTVQ